MLADAVHIAFKKVVQALQGELKLVLPSLLTEQVAHIINHAKQYQPCHSAGSGG